MFDYRKYKTLQEATDDLVKNPDIRSPDKARKYLYANIPLESYFQKNIIVWIRKIYPISFVWKAAAGAYSRRGIPDICCIVDGQYYGFEVKRPLIGVPSKIQERTIEQIRVAGGIAAVVSYPEEVARIITINSVHVNLTFTGGEESEI